jgi:hypothetical protein
LGDVKTVSTLFSAREYRGRRFSWIGMSISDSGRESMVMLEVVFCACKWQSAKTRKNKKAILM